MTAWSMRFMDRAAARSGRDRRRTGPRPQIDRREDERGEREQHEQDEQDDRELPQSPLDAAPAAVDGGVAAERAGQAGAPRLQQDGGDQGDADDDLADRQKRIHAEGPPDGTAADGITDRAASAPVIPSQRGSPASSTDRRRDVGEDPVVEAASLHRSARRATIGTGLSEWAVTGRPSASRISSALPWSAVTIEQRARARPDPTRRGARRRPTIRARQRVDRREARRPSPPRRRCGRPCPGWRSWRR